VEESLKRQVYENEDGKWVEMDVRFEGRVAQEFEVQAGRSELWWCRDSGMQAGIRCLGRRKKGLARVLRSQTLSQHGTIHRSGGRMKKGEVKMAPALPLTRVVVIQSVCP
jgi:hypothetical protein